jgi:hypothetical protein
MREMELIILNEIESMNQKRTTTTVFSLTKDGESKTLNFVVAFVVVVKTQLQDVPMSGDQ